MPELPDVEVYKRYIDSTSLSKTITEVEVLDSRVLVDTSPEELARAAKGRAFQESDRRGKHLFVKLDGDHWLALHFRMTSYPRYCKKASADDDRESRYDAVRFHLDNGYLLAFNSRRKLGRMQLIEDPEWFAQAHELGPDALSLAEDEFVEIIDRPRGRVKSTLMNQLTDAGVSVEDHLFETLDTRTREWDLPDGRQVYVALDESVRGSNGPFYSVYLDRDRSERYGYLCGNCDGFGISMDTMGRVVCKDCENRRKPTRWDASYL